MSKSKISLVLISVITTILISSCSRIPSVAVGNYYLDGDNTKAYIQIISKNQLVLHGFDTDALIEGLISGYDLKGKDYDDYWEELQYAFSNTLDFEVDEWPGNDYRLAVPADGINGYYFAMKDANTLSFYGNRYIQP